MNDVFAKMDEYESKFNWRACYQLFASEKSGLTEEYKLNFSVRILFLSTYWLLEANYSEDEEIELTNKIKTLFNQSNFHFKNNPDYLFCLGVITRLNEYIFDFEMDDPTKLIELSIQLAPQEQLYKDWLRFRNNQELFSVEYYSTLFIKKWAKDKGFLAKYVLGFLVKDLDFKI